MNPKSRLGLRLNAIYELTKHLQQNNVYTTIWDCCCDHGYLGTKILNEKLCNKLFMVDQLPHVIQQLEKRLQPYVNDEVAGRFELLAADVSQLTFAVEQKHLIILAGIGGDNLVQITQAIEQKNSHSEIDYIFCPSSKPATLRNYLQCNDFSLLTDISVEEKSRLYEILHVQRKHN
jgi:tRNA (adenine22-N1)-methyltransferase